MQIESLEQRAMLATNVFNVDGSWTSNSQAGTISGTLSIDTDTGRLNGLSLSRVGGNMSTTSYGFDGITAQGSTGATSYSLTTAARGSYELRMAWGIPSGALATYTGGSVSSFSFTSPTLGTFISGRSATITNRNDSPTDVLLSSAAIAENAPAGSTVGVLTTLDPDVGDAFTYALVAGVGSSDNDSFTIIGNQLKSTSSFNFESKNSYSVRVRSMDTGGLSIEKTVTITVSDVPEFSFGSGAWGWAGAVVPGNRSVKSVASDSSGNVYVAGHFGGNPDFDMGPGTAVLSSNAADGFVAKYSSTGAFLWVVQIGGSQEQYPEGLTVDPSGNVLVCGYFSGAATFGTGLGSTTFASSNGYDGFIFKLNSFRQSQWVKTFAGTYGCYLGSIAADASGAATAIGPFSDSTIDFNPGVATANLTATGRHSVVVKLDASGNYAWATNFAGGSASDVATDAAGNIFVTGIYQYTVDFDPGPNTAALTSNAQAAYAVKLSASGGYLWARSLANSDWAHVPHAAFDASGNAFIAGQFTGTVDFDGTSAVDSRTAQGTSWDAFATKFSASGDYFWTRQISGAADESIENLATNAGGDVFIAGTFAGAIDADPGVGVISLTSAGGTDAMLVQLSASGDFRSAKRYGGTAGDSAKDVIIDNSGSTVVVGQFNNAVVSNPVDFGPSPGDAALMGGDQPAFVLKLINNGPTDITLSASSIAENRPAGTIVGALSATDPDAGDSLTYSFVAGTGFTDNALFSIVGNTVKTAASFNYESKSRYGVRVRATDRAGLYTETAFAISVADVQELPVIDGIGNVTVAKDSGQALVSLSGIRAGDSLLSVRVTAVSSDPSLVPNPAVDYVSRTFTTAATISTGVQRTHGVAVGDFNGDGKMDIAANGATNGIFRVTYGDGVGGFSAPVSVSVGYEAYFVVADDFNSDGIDDVAVSNFENNLITVRLGSANGTFGPQRSFASGNGTWWPDWTGVWYLATGDFNGDGRRDIVSCNIRHDFIAIYLGDGAGGFGSPIKTGVWGSTPTTGAQDGPYGVVVKDFNRDGKDDVAVAVMGDNTVRVLLGNGAGGLAVSSAVVVGPSPRGLTAGDFDNDGCIDLAAANTGDGTVNVIRGDGAGGFSAASTFTGGAGTIEIAAADLDRDGCVDLVTSSSQGQVFRLRGRGNGTFGTPESFALGPSNQQQTFSVIKDVNGDRFPDITSIGEVWNQIPGDIDVLLSQPVTTGSLALSPVAGKSGSATVSVTVEDGGPDGDLLTSADNNVVIRTFTVTVTDPNFAPTGISLSASSVAENSPTATVVGTLATTDGNIGDTFTYTLVSGVGSADNGSFVISGKSLVTATIFDYETRKSYSVRVRSTDQGGLWTETAFIITVTDINEAPTNLSLSRQTVAENSPIGTTVGTLSATDPEGAGLVGFSLVSGEGATGNASFTIAGSTLRTAAVLDFEAGPTRSIRVRATDAGGAFREAVFVITVRDLVEDWAIDVAMGAQQVDPLTRTGSSRFVKTGEGSLVLDQANAHSGGVVVQAGTLVLRNVNGLGTGRLTVRPGARVVFDVGTSGVDLSGLTIETGGVVDMGRCRVTLPPLAYSLSDVVAALKEGRADGLWAGAVGLISPTAGSLAGGGLGYIVNDDGSLTVGFAATGDTNLDGTVDVLDISTILASSRFDTEGFTTWTEGDFNYDQVSDILDISDVLGASLFNAGTYIPSQSSPAQPQPTNSILSVSDAAFMALATESTTNFSSTSVKKRRFAVL